MNIRGCSSVGESNLASVKYPLLEGLGERRKIGRVKQRMSCAYPLHDEFWVRFPPTPLSDEGGKDGC